MQFKFVRYSNSVYEKDDHFVIAIYGIRLFLRLSQNQIIIIMIFNYLQRIYTILGKMF